MKKAISLLFLFSIIFSGIAIAQEKINVNAQIRPRFNYDKKDFNGDTGANTYTELRTRLGVSYSPSSDLTGFIQIQDSRLYGSEASTLSNSKNLDLHQGYFTLNNFFKLPLNVKVGRTELSYGAERLIGAVGWHNVGRSFDGAVVTLFTKPVDIDFILVRTNESGLVGDEDDQFLFSAYGNLKVLENFVVEPFLISENRKRDDFSRFTIGVYAKSSNKNSAFKHELDLAYQAGTQQADQSISAFMIAYNISYTFNTNINPVVSGGIDYLSGDDGEDAGKYKVFNTLYATNHKFYGYMDYFLNIPQDTYGLGLMDIHVKGSIVPLKKFKVALALHMFNANSDYTLNDGNTSTSFGTEADLTLGYEYSKNVNFIGGFSYFSPGDIFKEERGEDSSTWTYIMAVVNL